MSNATLFLRLAGMALLLLASGCATSSPAEPSAPKPRSNRAAWPVHTLKADRAWQLNLPDSQQFDASGLLLTPSGELLTINDRGATLFQIRLKDSAPDADLQPIPGMFTEAQLARYQREKHGRYDGEGIAQDQQGRFYICEEADRWILRYDPKTSSVERLPIDWTPASRFFSKADRNASFEGIAIGKDRLYVANERSVGRIIVVDLNTLQVVDHFSVHPRNNEARDIHYSDLSWFDGHLFVLLRESRCVLQVDPETKRVVAEFSFRNLEQQPEVVYRTRYPTGTMEGLAVDANYIWLVTDNNGLGRVRYPEDRRPTLFRCRRPDR